MSKHHIIQVSVDLVQNWAPFSPILKGLSATIRYVFSFKKHRKRKRGKDRVTNLNGKIINVLRRKTFMWWTRLIKRWSIRLVLTRYVIGKFNENLTTAVMHHGFFCLLWLVVRMCSCPSPSFGRCNVVINHVSLIFSWHIRRLLSRLQLSTWCTYTQMLYERFGRWWHRLRPYHVENTGSRPITEVKQRRARSVLGWVTAWEYRVL